MVDNTYSISEYYFGYYNVMSEIDIIVYLSFVNKNRGEELAKAREIVRREIDNWSSCEDENSHYHEEGYLDSVYRELAKENIEVDIYDKVDKEG